MPVSHHRYHLRWQSQQRAASVSDRLPAMLNTGPEPVLDPATLAAAAMAEGGKHAEGGSFRQQPQEEDPLQDVPPFAQISAGAPTGQALSQSRIALLQAATITALQSRPAPYMPIPALPLWNELQVRWMH
jgi:hypothetical protein